VKVNDEYFKRFDASPEAPEVEEAGAPESRKSSRGVSWRYIPGAATRKRARSPRA
jgi:hypothetical protein